MDIFRILESEGVTGIGALYKFSPSKFVLVFGLKTAKEKLAGTEFQCRFGESEIKLNFPKRVGPLRNGKEPTLVNIFLPVFISNQAVRLAFSKFGEVVSVFKGRHNFNRKIRNGKRYVKIFPAGGNPTILPRKISFHGSVRRDVLFPEKVVLCYRYKTRHMLGENCPVATPTPKDSHMSFIEHSKTPRESLASEKPYSFVETQSSAESQQESLPIEERTDGENSTTEETDTDSVSGSASGSSNEVDSELVSSAPETPLQKPVSSTSQENLPATQKAQYNSEPTSETNPHSVGNQKSNEATSNNDQSVRKKNTSNDSKT